MRPRGHLRHSWGWGIKVSPPSTPGPLGSPKPTRRKKYSLPWEAPSPEVASVSVRERQEENEEVSTQTNGRAGAKRKKLGQAAARRTHSMGPGILSPHSRCRERALTALPHNSCCQSGRDLVPFPPPSARLREGQEPAPLPSQPQCPHLQNGDSCPAPTPRLSWGAYDMTHEHLPYRRHCH